MEYIVFDTETTGTTRKFSALDQAASFSECGDEIIQIGGLVLDDRMEPTRGFCHYCDVLTSRSDKGAQDVHGIDLDAVRQEIPGVFVDEVVWKWCPEFFLPSVTFIGYNFDFDNKMLAQGLRNHPYAQAVPTKIVDRVKKTGRHFIDVMQFLPEKRRLSQYFDALASDRREFYETYEHKLPFECNCPDLFMESWSHAHNAFYDAVETYLLFKHSVWQKRLFGR